MSLSRYVSGAVLDRHGSVVAAQGEFADDVAGIYGSVVSAGREGAIFRHLDDVVNGPDLVFGSSSVELVSVTAYVDPGKDLLGFRIGLGEGCLASADLVGRLIGSGDVDAAVLATFDLELRSF